MPHQDITSITQLINLYGLAVDSQRWELFDRVFTDDVEADFGETAHWYDLKSFKHDFGIFHDPFDSTQHCMMNHMVHINGDKANSMTYGTWRLVRKAADGNPLWDGSGWYDDEWIRTDAGWRISHRKCRIVWWTGNPQVNETIPGVVFKLDTTVLRRDGEAGNVSFLNAVLPKNPGTNSE